MAVYPAPALILVPALVVNVALAARGGWARRAAPKPPAASVGALVAVAAALACGAWLLFPSWERAWPVLLGLALGAILALYGLRFPSQDEPVPLGLLGGGLAALSILALSVGDATLFANGLLGLLGAWGALSLLSQLEGDATPPMQSLPLALVAATAAGAAWGEKLYPGANFGAPLAAGLGTLLAIALLLGARVDQGRPSGWAGRLTAFALFVLGSAGLVLGMYAQPWTLLLAIALGAALGLLTPLVVPAEGPWSLLRALALFTLGGVLLVLDNRLMGILAIAWGALGLGIGSLGGRPLIGMLVAIFAARAWLQLFLDRTLLTGYGIDLTHPYAFAALILGGLLPLVALAVARLSRPSRALTAIWAVALALAPVWVGYFIHVEALGSLLAGLLLATFALGVQEPPDSEIRPVLPTLLLTHVAVTLLAAPWLVSVMNATRQARMGVFVAGLIVAAVWVLVWWTTTKRRPQLPA